MFKIALTPSERAQCMALRHTIFVEGQSVPIDIEVDGKDDESEHYLWLETDVPVGVARVRLVNTIGKIERVGILDEYQGKGIGKELMLAIIARLRTQSTISAIKLSSQTHAIPFYEKLGFSICSEAYLDANILHQDMVLANG